MGPAIAALQADPLHGWRENHEIGIGGIGLDLQHGLDPLVARLDVGDVDAAIEQEDFDLLGTVGKKQDIDARMLAGRPLQDRAGQVGLEIGQQIEQFERRVAQGGDQRLMLLALIEGAVSPQLGLDLGVVGKGGMLGQAQLAGGLFLGVVIVGNAILRHQAGGDTGDAGPGTGSRVLPFMTGHGDAIKVESPPF